MAARPRKLPFIRRREVDGKLQVTVTIIRPGWARWLGGPGEVERTLALDSLGREVYDACDGRTRVAKIVRDFASRHKVSVAESEAAVTTFLQTLMKKGLVEMAIDAKK
jgi:hypothetical protein